ncbi:MAG TPA: hypothetical protein VGC74_17095 [Stenotrophomonas sp.]|jgi:hypothetical protein
MSGFLQRLVQRTHDPVAPLRRRRPSLFETKEAPSAPATLSESMDLHAPAAPAREVHRQFHTREVRVADGESVARAAPRSEVAPMGESASPRARATANALPTPPALRAAPTPTEALRVLPKIAALAPTPDPSIVAPARRNRPALDDATPAPRALRREAATPSADEPMHRRQVASRHDDPKVPHPPALPLPPRLPNRQRAAEPIAHPARRAALPPAAETSVQVSIGSVEIRAQAPAKTPEKARARAPIAPTGPSLEAYLHQRHGGPR